MPSFDIAFYAARNLLGTKSLWYVTAAKFRYFRKETKFSHLTIMCTCQAPRRDIAVSAFWDRGNII